MASLQLIDMETFAIIQTGGKQVRVSPKQVIAIERVAGGQAGKDFVLDKVLAASDGKNFEVGTPYLKGASVVCEYLAEEKGPKTVIFKMRRRKNYRRKKGHRQIISQLRVKEIQLKG